MHLTCKFHQIKVEGFLDKSSDVLPLVSLVGCSGLRTYVNLVHLFNKNGCELNKTDRIYSAARTTKCLLYFVRSAVTACVSDLLCSCFSLL